MTSRPEGPDRVFLASRTTEPRRPGENGWEVGDTAPPAGAEPCAATPAASCPSRGTRHRAAPPGPAASKWVCAWGRPNFLSRARAASGRSRKTLCVDGIRTDGGTDGCRGREGELRGEPDHTCQARGSPKGREPVLAPRGPGPRSPPERTGKPPPLGTPAGPGGPGSGRSEAPRLESFLSRGFGADVSARFLGFGGQRVGTRPS